MWTIFLAYFIDLTDFTVVKEDVVVAAVNSFDVNAKSHDDLEV